MRLYKIKYLLCIVCAAWLLPACLGETDGVAPPNDEFIFPVALASIHDDSHLLVVNANSDLLYNAGTLVSYDLSRLYTFFGQNLFYNESSGVFTLPAGATISEYCTAGTSGAYCDLDPADGIRSDETIRIGSGASDINITPAGDRALIPVRGDRTIVLVDIDPSNGANLMDCGDKANDERRCDESHKIVSNGSVTFPIEPSKVETMDYTYADETGAQVMETLGFATHTAGGEVSLFSVASQRGDGPRTYNNKLIRVRGGVVPGAWGLAVNPLKQEIYVAGKRDDSPHVAVLRVETDLEDGGSYLNDPWFSQANTIGVYKHLDSTSPQGIAVSPDGKTGFLTILSPPTLVKMDLETYTVQDTTTVCSGAYKVDTFVDERDPDNDLDDKLYAFVLCYLTRQVYVVDADYMIPVIRKTGEGPQDISFDRQRKIAYIANFMESSVTMIQAVAPFNLIRVQSESDLKNAPIIRIGGPNLSKGN